MVDESQNGVRRYQALVVKQGLKACKKGLRLNRSYTPTNLRRNAEQITGKKFKARDYDGMIAALDEWLGIDPPVPELQ